MQLKPETASQSIGTKPTEGYLTPLTPAQITALTSDIAVNTATVAGASGQIKDLAHTPDNAFAVAAWYNLTASQPFGYYHSVPGSLLYGQKIDQPTMTEVLLNG